MKAAVMESNSGRSVVLTEDGVFVEIEGSYKAGEVIDYTEYIDNKEQKQADPVGAWARTRAHSLRRIAAAACLVVALTAGIFSLQVPSAYACVELGNGYCVRYLLDEDLKVIDVEASESSGNELAQCLISDGVRGKDINEAIEMAEERTGLTYDASSEPPKISCKDDSAAEDISNDIREHHSAEGRTDVAADKTARPLSGGQAPDMSQGSASSDKGADRPSGNSFTDSVHEADGSANGSRAGSAQGTDGSANGSRAGSAGPEKENTEVRGSQNDKSRAERPENNESSIGRSAIDGSKNEAPLD